MKKLFFAISIFFTISATAQVFDDFSDGNFTENPEWFGNTENFIVNDGWLQSNATAASNSQLFTLSEAIDDAEWNCSVKINYNPSAQNYSAIYIIADRAQTDTCNGYYVQIGNTNDEVSLYVQKGTTKTKIIDGMDRRTDTAYVAMDIKVTRDAEGNFALYSKKATEDEYFLEGTRTDLSFTRTKYFGLKFVNSGTTGNRYFFDNVNVTGNAAIDTEAPLLLNYEIANQNSLQLLFSEEMNFENAVFEVDNAIGTPSNIVLSADKKTSTLTFSRIFERGIPYTLYAENLTDEAGNFLEETVYVFGIIETPDSADVVWNEVMFDAPTGAVEYAEIVNRSDKLIDVSRLYFATLGSSGLTTARRISENTRYLLPNDYLAVCPNADSLLRYFNYPPESKVVTTAWTTLNNTSATLVLFNAAKDTIYDEFTYNSGWHHVLIKNERGVALEKINPDMPSNRAESWHSAASEVKYGTPGYKNSQFREITPIPENENFVYTVPQAFSPDNDGFEDVCFIHYDMGESGFLADITIFTITGVPIKRVASNFLLQSEGFIIWDGSTDSATKVNTGVYVILFEARNPINGAKKVKKVPITVSYR